MSGCNSEDLEALVYGELSQERTADVERHAAECAECAECADELAWLRAENAVMREREREQSDLPAELWEGIQARIDVPAAVADSDRRGLLFNLFPWRGERVRWFGFGLATAAAAATLMFVLVRAPDQGGRGQVAVANDAGGAVEPDPDPRHDDRLAEADRALDEAEAAHLAAIAALESAYAQQRDKLDPAVAANYDEQFEQMRKTLDGARAVAGDDIGARLRVLDAYAAHRRSMKSALYQVEERN